MSLLSLALVLTTKTRHYNTTDYTNLSELHKPVQWCFKFWGTNDTFDPLMVLYLSMHCSMSNCLVYQPSYNLISICKHVSIYHNVHESNISSRNLPIEKPLMGLSPCSRPLLDPRSVPALIFILEFCSF